MKQQRWTRESAIAAVRAFASRTGYQPVSSEANRANRLPNYNAAVRLFGSWNALIEAAGFKPYPARSSANAKQLAWRDRHPDWRERVAETRRSAA